ncbi:MAG: cupin domain-containing protein [Phycisphaerales bacterium]
MSPSSSMDAESIKRLLELHTLPHEGGWFHETYRAQVVIPAGSLPDAYPTDRNAGTAIYYLLTPDDVSAMHRLPSDEVFHFYMGDPVQQLRLYDDGRTETVILGTDLLSGQRPQATVLGNAWQGARLLDGGRFALLGCTVSPGFDFEDYEHGERETLIARWPDAADEITRLTRA